MKRGEFYLHRIFWDETSQWILPRLMPLEVFQHIRLLGAPRADLKLTEGIIYLISRGTVLGASRRTWGALLGRRAPWLPASVCCHSYLVQDKLTDWGTLSLNVWHADPPPYLASGARRLRALRFSKSYDEPSILKQLSHIVVIWPLWSRYTLNSMILIKPARCLSVSNNEIVVCPWFSLVKEKEEEDGRLWWKRIRLIRCESNGAAGPQTWREHKENCSPI